MEAKCDKIQIFMFYDFDRLSITAGELAFFICMLRFSIKLPIEWYIRRRDRRGAPTRPPSLVLVLKSVLFFNKNSSCNFVS